MNKLKSHSRIREHTALWVIATAGFLLLTAAGLWFARSAYKANAGGPTALIPAVYFAALFAVSAAKSWLRRRLGRAYLPLILTFYIGALLTALAFTAFVVYIASYEAPAPEQAPDVVIVLGCRTIGMTPGATLKTRLDEAVTALADYPGALCVVSGGQGYNESAAEAAAMAGYLISAGIDPGRIMLEDGSHNTAENLRLTAELLDGAGAEYGSVLILTSEYHLPRAMGLASKAGFGQAYGRAAVSPVQLFAPGVLREVFAYMKYMVLG